MIKYNLNKSVSFIFIILAALSYFVGFYFGENSAGAGGFNGDIAHIWNNLNIFINNDIISSITHPDYYDSRLPAAYIIHEFLNPFIDTQKNFRISVFVISLIIPILFFFMFKEKI